MLTLTLNPFWKVQPNYKAASENKSCFSCKRVKLTEENEGQKVDSTSCRKCLLILLLFRRRAGLSLAVNVEARGFI